MKSMTTLIATILALLLIVPSPANSFDAQVAQDPRIDLTTTHPITSIAARQSKAAVSSLSAADSCCTLRGDVNSDGSIDISDLTLMINYLIRQKIYDPFQVCFEHIDVNASGGLDIADMTYFVRYMFKAGPPPAPCP